MYDVIIIGSGAAGLFLAKQLNNKKVLVLEKTSKSGNKLKISGNGKCNFTKLIDTSSFIDHLKVNNKFMYSSLSNYNPYDIYDYFLDQRLHVDIREGDRVFCQKTSRDLLYILETNECEIKYDQEVIDIKDNTVITKTDEFSAKYIVIATGGMSYKETGSSGYIYDFAKEYSLETIKPYPVEARIHLQDPPLLMGTSIQDVVLSNGKYSSTGNLMFTHSGLSGSSALKISEDVYKQNMKEIAVDFLPRFDEIKLHELITSFHRDSELKTFLKEYFTQAFSKYIIDESQLKDNIKVKQLNSKDIDEVIHNIKSMTYEVKCVDTVERATVTGGGLAVKELNNKTFALKKYPHIYVIGESIDVHGPIGGYNITLAFSEAYTVFLDLQEKL